MFHVVFILVFCQVTATSQSCLPEGITFSTQNQIDNFQLNYPGCKEIEGDVEITGNDITNLNGLIVLTSIGSDLNIDNSNALTSLTGLDNMTSIGTNFYIYSNEALTNLTGVQDLISIGGILLIGNNFALNSIAGLDNLISIGGGLSIGDNYALNSLMGMEGLTFIGGDLDIRNNDVLTNLAGLENLTSIGGPLFISQNDGLNNLTGLESLTSIGGELQIYNNYSLISLIGLDNLDAGSISDIYIVNNSFLSTCAVESICNYLASPNGTIEIHDNETGCDSREEAEEACGVSVSEIDSHRSTVTGYPNPFRCQTALEYYLEYDTPVDLSIFNHLGQEVDVLVEENQYKGKHQVTWNADELPSGIYFYRLTAGSQSSTGKMVVVK